MTVYTVERYAPFIVTPSSSGRIGLVKCWSEGVVIWINFYDRAIGELPSNSWNGSNKTAQVHLTKDTYTWVVDLLRNERPIKLSFDEDTGGFYLAAQTREPVGVGDEA